MKSGDKRASEAASLSVSDAAAVLGVSSPTVRRMMNEGSLAGFHTPGGQLRILTESIDGVKERQELSPRAVRGPSSVIQNRREGVEELSLEVQAHRARRELEKLRREDEEEAEKRRIDEQARKDAEDKRQTELALERERLAFERGQEMERKKQARTLIEFHNRWCGEVGIAVLAYSWLSAAQQKEVIEALESEVEKRKPSDEPRMVAIIARSLEALVEPLKLANDLRKMRQSFTEKKLRQLPNDATEAERALVTDAIVAAQAFLEVGNEHGFQVMVNEAVQSVRKASEERKKERDRELKKPYLIQQGIGQVRNYLLCMRNRGEISRGDFKDPDFVAEMKDAVERGLEAKLTGDEDAQRVEELVVEIIEGEFDQ